MLSLAAVWGCREQLRAGKVLLLKKKTKSKRLMLVDFSEGNVCALPHTNRCDISHRLHKDTRPLRTHPREASEDQGQEHSLLSQGLHPHRHRKLPGAERGHLHPHGEAASELNEEAREEPPNQQAKCFRTHRARSHGIQDAPPTLASAARAPRKRAHGWGDNGGSTTKRRRGDKNCFLCPTGFQSPQPAAAQRPLWALQLLER